MQQTADGNGKSLLVLHHRKTLVRMKLMAITLFFAISLCLGDVQAQNLSLTLQDAPLTSVIKAIEGQTPYRFVYTKEQQENSRPVSLDVRNQTLENVLNAAFKSQPFDYVIEDKLIILRNRKQEPSAYNVYDITGKVVTALNESLAGISIKLKGSRQVVVSNGSGEFLLPGATPSSVLEISGAEIEPLEMPVNGRKYLLITVSIKVNNLDGVVVMAYGQTTQRLNTGNIAKITAEEIDKQPVSNPLAALQGRVAGLTITQTSGVPGSAFKVELRGRSSLDLRFSRNDPLFIIDGIPFEPGNNSYNQLASSASMPLNTSEGGLSPLHNINPSDIESIEILKDADATAIYGSRGANGVVLITTKKGKPGVLKARVSFVQSWSRTSRTMDMMNTSEYLSMRKEAFVNDGINPTQFNAPDLLVWDTTRYTDFKKLLIGRTAQASNFQASVSGGTEQTNFLLSAHYLRQSNVFSNSLFDTRAGFHLNVGHTSSNKKLALQFSTSFSTDDNRLLSADLTGYINTLPHLKLYNDDGSIAWQDDGVFYSSVQGLTNPLSMLQRKYRAKAGNLAANMHISYALMKSLSFKAVVGYNQFTTEESGIVPSASLSPNLGILPSANFANSTLNSWIAEPQLQFQRQWRNQHHLTVLAGATFQQKVADAKSIEASQYTNDLLLETPEAAGFTRATRTYSSYKYGAAFGRVQYDYKKRYLVNLTARRDGSSRFGPANRFANFASAGVAWIFSREAFVERGMQWLSYGKIRGSYGVTGNDQIGDYQYLDLWSTSSLYQGVAGLEPNKLSNASYSWERNRKAEIAIELEFAERFLASASFYRNRSSNQLISYQLPNQTGFSSVVKNFPALVENRGWEITANIAVIRNSLLSWNIAANITLPKNKLIAFPGLETSSYSGQFKVGASINSYNGIKYQGIDANTGVYTFEQPLVFQYRGALDPKYYGGLQNTLRLGAWSLSFLLEFRKQPGRNYLHVVRATLPGRTYNQPVIVLDRWQKPGDEAAVQRYTTRPTGAAGAAANYLNNSDAVYSDASYARLKNIHLSLNFSTGWAKRIGVQQGSLYVAGQNLFVISKYKGSDPESQNLYALPPLKTIAVGIQLNF